MAIEGALIGGAIGAFGKKPKIPKFQEISPEDVQKKTVSGNIATFQQASQLASSVNLFNQEQLDALIEKRFPGATKQIETNIMAELKGELPPDVVERIRRFGAEQSQALGVSGSQFSADITASSLGLTSLAQTERGLTSAERWLAMTAAPVMDVTSMFFSPQQMLNFDVEERNARFRRDLMAAQVKAAPDPATAALGQEIDRFFNTVAGFGLLTAGQGLTGGFGDESELQAGKMSAKSGGGSGFGLAGGGVSIGQSSLDGISNYTRNFGYLGEPTGI